jgi:tetratricopeptide (TPR) repeat protein
MRELTPLFCVFLVLVPGRLVSQENEIAALERRIEEEPGDFESTWRLAQIFIDQANYISAESIINNYLTIDSTNARALYLYGRVMDLTDNIAEAIDYYSLSIDHDSTFWMPYRDLAFLYDIFCDYEKTYQYLSRAAALAPVPDSLYFDLGYSLDMLEMPDSALHYYGLALEFDPDDHQASLNIGAIWGNRGQIDSARIYTERSINSNPEFAEACFNYAEIMSIDGDTLSAITYFLKALARDQAMFAAKKRLGDLFEARGDSAMAMIYFQEFLESAPMIYADDIAEVLEKLGRYK